MKPITAEQVASVVTQLRQREKSHRAKGWALILGAVPLLFVGPLFIGTCVYFLDRHREHYSTAGWIGAVALTAAFAIPLLFLFERLNGDRLMTSTAEAVGQADYSRLAGRAGAGVLIIDIFCWGPRMVLSGFRRFGSNSVVTECDHQLAAQWICKLLRLEQGTLTPEIVDGNDPKSVPTLTYLCKYEWIDISTNGERIWLLSDARKVLTAP